MKWFCVCLILLLIGCWSCVDSLDQFIQNAPQPTGVAIKHKSYNHPSLPWDKLASLLDMAVYSGSPDSYGTLVMRRSTSNTNADPVVFSHRIHRTKYTCRVCHIELEFSMKKGGSGITREDYLDGRYCGACHDGKISFSVKFACNLCHISDKKQKVSYVDPAYESLAATLPEQGYGDKINWVKAIENGDIKPKHSLYEGTPLTGMPLPDYLKDPLRWYTNVSGVHVAFPHEAHIAWLDCSNCHPDIFEIKNMGTVSFDKEKNLYGYYCGTCHMTVAFPMNGCSRCHPGQNDRH
jgi:c(7)-type cytochrome triheme protein